MKTTGLVFIKVFLSITLSHSIDILKGFIIALPQNPTIACQIWVQPTEKGRELLRKTVPTKLLRVHFQFY